MGYTGEILSERSHYSEFICSICSELIDLDEGLITKCSHVFCRFCLQEWLKRKKTCPNCQLDLSYFNTSATPYLKHANPLAWRVLNQVKLRCPDVGGTCKWTGDYSELQAHLLSSTNHKEIDIKEQAETLKQQGLDKYKNKNFSDALKLFTKAVEICDNNPAIYSNRGTVYYSLGNFELAIQDFLKAISLDENGTMKNAYLLGSKSYSSLGKFDDALELLANAPEQLKLSSNFLQIKKHIGDLSLKLKKGTEALKNKKYQDARAIMAPLLTETKAANIILQIAMAEAYIGSGERALKLSIDVLRKNPYNSFAFRIRSLCLLFDDKIKEAFDCIKECMHLSPDDQESLETWKLIKEVKKEILAAREDVNNLKYQESLPHFKHLLRLDLPERCTLKINILAEQANCFFRLKMYDSALTECAKAIYVQEDNRRAWLTRIYTLHALEKHEDALTDLEGLMKIWGANDSVIKGCYEKALFEVRKQKRPDYYNLLTPNSYAKQLSSFSSEPEIKSAYKLKALECHPDRLGPHASLEDRKEKENEFKLVGEGFEILTDQFKRSLYDKGFDKEAIEERVKRAYEQENKSSHRHRHS